MDETKLDEATLSAQMQEKERLRRVQEQLRANRDVSFVNTGRTGKDNPSFFAG